MAEDYAGRARALVGTRFRPQGRDRAVGLDCIGLVAEACGVDLHEVRRNYRLRGDHRVEIERGMEPHFRKVSPSRQRPGDVLLLSVAREQLHLSIVTENGFVHAHAGIGRVVETPGQPEWEILGVYRRRSKARLR